MATTYYPELQKLYVAYFNRPADPGGLAYWETQLEANGGNLATVSAAFAGSAEYKAEYGNLTTAQVVDKIYQNLFGRVAETTGKNYWVEQLDKKGFTIDEAVKIIGDAAQGTDATAYGNKVKAATAFTAALDTPAEQAGYAGPEALKLAKEFLADVTTDASLAAAVATANLNAVVNDVVHAGTPFTLIGALGALDAAIEAKTAFLVTADGDDNAKTSATEGAITGAVTTAEGAIDTLVAGTYVGASAGIKAALLADQQEANTTALGVAEKAYTTAVAAADKVTGLTAAIAALEVATEAEKAAEKVQADAVVVANAAEVAYEGYNAATITVGADGTVAGLIVLKDGELVLADKVTETTNKGVTALLNAVTARVAADAAEAAAHATTVEAGFTVDTTDVTAGAADELLAVGQGIKLTGDLAADELPTAAQITAELTALQAAVDAAAPGSQAETDAKDAQTTFKGLLTTFQTADTDNALADAVALAKTDVEAKEKAIADLAEAVADLTDAQALATQLAGLNDAIKFAQDTFTANEYKLPVTLGASNAGTSGNDIFLADKAATTTLVNFGVAGEDILYVGSGYKLNTTGDTTKGVNTDLEVFFVKSGTSTKVIVETSAFGTSASTPEVLTITVTGVAPEQLKFDNGIITHV